MSLSSGDTIESLSAAAHGNFLEEVNGITRHTEKFNSNFRW